MTGVCGWLMPSTPVDDAAVHIGRMRERLNATRQEGPAIAEPHHAATAWSPFKLASIHAEQDLLAVVDGRISWEDHDLERTARDVSQAAAILSGYRQHGIDCLRRMHGSFAVAVLEPGTGTALLAIDRMGINGLCFALKNDGVIFGSTADSVAVHPLVGHRLCKQGLFNYLFHHVVPAPGTIYEGVEKLLPAQYISVNNGIVSRGFYWQADWKTQNVSNKRDCVSNLKALLRDGVATAATQRRTGAFLSGGTDSSTVAGMLAQFAGQPADTFSIGFQAEGFDEIEYARIASRHFGTHQNEYYVTPDDVVHAIPLISAWYDEPFGNASAVPTYYCARNASNSGVNVMLAGDGGDELFGGNVRYAKQKVFEVYWHIPRILRTGLIEPLLNRLPGTESFAPFRKARSYVRQARIPLPDRIESYNLLHADTSTAVFTPDFLANVSPNGPIELMREPFFRTRSESAINRMLHLDWKLTLADSDLRKVNRMCEAAGVEVRYPLLDDRIVAFAAALPPSYKVKGLKLRWFFKEALKDFLPREIITKPKHGFGLPFGIWMQTHGALRELAYDSLNAFGNRGYVNTGYIERLITLHRDQHASYFGVMIWVIMMLEQWLTRHTDRFTDWRPPTSP